MAPKTSAVTPVQICSESLNNTEEQISSPGFTGEETQAKTGGLSCARSGVTKGRPAGRRVRHPDSSCYSNAHGGGGSNRWQQGTTSWSPPGAHPCRGPCGRGKCGRGWQNGSCVRAKEPRRLALTDGHRAPPFKEQQGPRRAQHGAQGVHSGVTRRERMC